MSGVVVLGATGSIGRQTLEVVDALERPVVGLAARTGSGDFRAIADRYPDARLAVADPADRDGLSTRYGDRIALGPDAVADLAATPETIVINGVVGFAGLDATLAALRAGNRLGLANKESLVAAGPVVTAELAHGGELIPIDSEHSAVFQCLVGEPDDAVGAIVLTASGGPFRGASPERLASVTVAEALDHPTWDMGHRITIDSATLANKGLEVIEAHHLFGVPFDRIEVVVHPQSVVHSLVRLVDGSYKAQLGAPDMRDPIRYAITHPHRSAAVDDFDLVGASLTFEAPDLETFPALGLAYAAGRAGGGAPAAFNAADEVAVAAFLDERVGFTDIPRIIAATLESVGAPPIDDVAAVRAVDAEARRVAASLVGSPS